MTMMKQERFSREMTNAFKQRREEAIKVMANFRFCDCA